MGHYDSCREADDDYERAKAGKRLKTRLSLMSDDQAGYFAEALESLVRYAKVVNGTMDQMEGIRRAIDKMEGRR